MYSFGLRKNIAAIESGATPLILFLARLSYVERLKETGLFTLERRPLRGDFMKMFKIMKGVDTMGEVVLSHRIRGHSLRVNKMRVWWTV